ncbi:tetratricopeptide repeat-containing sensor histidine kinase [Flavobacterium dankookense]|uniref:histidine kinase n=1 Tax=Flavobacterium dankookense TaxID=706186 RepID=A0A4R6Q811_9FLAO|nr:tetratricopeptide repeat-containing sensor histidine kinase [Flavobacterium dankookense]TDP57773.1 tetratricopeptide repeat protein [Flavobacterium dankookense]
MILKRFLFPILILALISACKNDLSFSTTDNDYSKCIANAAKYLKEQKHDSSYYYAEKAKNLATSSEQKIYALLQIAELQNIICDFSGVEETATQAYHLAPSNNYLLAINNFLGIAYQEQGDYKQALKYYYKCLNDTLNIVHKSIIKNNISVIYLETKEYNKAILTLKPLLNSSELKKDKLNYAKIIDNYGFALFNINDQNAEYYLNKSLKLREEQKDNTEIIASYIHLSQFYKTENPDVAFRFAQKALQAAQKVNSPDDKIEALKFMIASSNEKKIKPLALKQIALSDSINKIRQSAKNQFAKIKYDTSLLEKQKLKSEKQLYITLIFLVLVILSATLLFYGIRFRNQKKIEETAYKTEARIAKKLHDELANDVHNAIAFAETQNLEDPSNKEVLLENLDTIYTRTRNISNENKDIDTGEKYLENLKAIIATYNSTSRNIIVNTELFNAPKTSKEIKITIYRVIQELLVNMKKHSQCSIASISIKSNNKTVEINYSDNGIGVANLLNLKNGLQNAENRIHSLKGTITFDTEPNKGFKAKITIPK